MISALYTVGVEPPSMRKVVPVMKSVSGLARKQTAAAISMGCPSLLTVWWMMFLGAYCLPNSGSSLPCGLDEPLVQLRCVDQARHDPVRCDAGPCQLLRQAEGHVVQRGLRGAVGREMRVWRDCVSRRDLNQTPPAALFHRRSEGVDQSNRGDRVLMVVVDPFLKGGAEPRAVGLLVGLRTLFTRISMPSKADLAPSITAFDPSSVVTSPRTNFASPPTLRISSVTAAARSAVLPLMTTLLPR